MLSAVPAVQLFNSLLKKSPIVFARSVFSGEAISHFIDLSNAGIAEFITGV
jgi:hypothetical protein